MFTSGNVRFNGRWASASFNPGWGEPGEWYLSFSDGTSLRIDNIEGMGDQEKYLSKLSADVYRDKVITSNWIHEGTSDDVLKMMLEYVGYNDNARREDVQNLQKMKALVVESAAYLVKDLDTDDYSVMETIKRSRKFKKVLEETLEIVEFLHHCIRVYDALKAGESVGANWSNESFLKNFPDSPYVDRIRKLMEDPNY